MTKEKQEISPKNYALILEQMEANNMQGEPYKDAKTYKKWIDAGYQVKKGEKSKLKAIVMIETKTGLMPKQYSLFHKTQVKKIK